MCAETKKMPDRECLEDMIRRDGEHYAELDRLQSEILRWQEAYNDLVR
jgi:hypothetical protein